MENYRHKHNLNLKVYVEKEPKDIKDFKITLAWLPIISPQESSMQKYSGDWKNITLLDYSKSKYMHFGGKILVAVKLFLFININLCYMYVYLQEYDFTEQMPGAQCTKELSDTLGFCDFFVKL